MVGNKNSGKKAYKLPGECQRCRNMARSSKTLCQDCADKETKEKKEKRLKQMLEWMT